MQQAKSCVSVGTLRHAPGGNCSSVLQLACRHAVLHRFRPTLLGVHGRKMMIRFQAKAHNKKSARQRVRSVVSSRSDATVRRQKRKHEPRTVPSAIRSTISRQPPCRQKTWAGTTAGFVCPERKRSRRVQQYAALVALFVLTAPLKSPRRRRACFASAVYRPPSLVSVKAGRVKTGRQVYSKL